MAGLDFDLNLEAPESGQMNPIDWDDIVEFDGPAHELDYDMVYMLLQQLPYKERVFHMVIFSFLSYSYWKFL